MIAKILLLLIPLKIFSVKIAGLDLTFFRVSLVVFTLLSLMKMIVFRGYRKIFYELSKSPIMRAILYFSIYMTFSTAFAFLTNTSLLYRTVYTYLSMLSYILFFSYIVSIEAIAYKGSYFNIFRDVSKFWYFCVALAIPQLILSLLGINISYEHIGEAAPENVVTIAGIDILRPNSLFGEPRDYAALLVGILLMYQFLFKKTSMKVVIWIFWLGIGFFTGSVTYILFLITFFAYVLLIEKNSNEIKYAKQMKVILMFSLAVVAIISYFYADIILPRVTNYIALAAAGNLEVGGDLYAQAVDWIVALYVFDIVTLNKNILLSLFGNGIGSFNSVLDAYFVNLFNYSPVSEGELLGSRFLPFTILVELGIIGLIFILYLIIESFRQIDKLDSLSPRKKRDFKRWFIAFFIGGMVSASYIFMIGPVFIMIISYYEDNQRQQKTKS